MTSQYQDDGTLVLDQPATLPDVLDVLIVGGGPAGTSTAFRAKELGLSALIIDIDDLLKRIRDYPKDKLILPGFGGGDRMKFPAGGDLVQHLHFDPIDKDDICAAWRGYCRQFSVPVKIGIELTGLEPSEGGGWRALMFNHGTRQPETLLAKHVVLALGRGVPRRFDIPGNTDGVAYRLDDPENYVDGPACIIGGGTSAAEAVIAISHAKISAENQSPIYWSYRGAKMPKVSKALSEAFFEAYLGNGNIRYHPHSEPVAVVTGPDRAEFLSIRIDRKNTEGRPAETVHLEFPKTQCVACIGEDIPEAFLAQLGIDMVVMGAGPAAKKMMLVSPLLETQQPNVYLIGDLLSKAYMETEDFSAAPDTYRQIKHRGNIKSSLRDGVFVAEVIQQRLEGRVHIDVVIRDAEQVPTTGEATPKPDPPGVSSAATAATVVLPANKSSGEVAYLSRVTPAEIEAEQYEIRLDRPTTIGRSECDINFPQDTLLNEHHASISRRQDGFFLRDDGSRSGTYLKVRPDLPITLGPGGIVRLGQQILSVGEENGGLALTRYDDAGKRVGKYPLSDRTLVFGRSGGPKNPDIVLDERDLTLSRFHVSATLRGSVVELEDFNSRNGTFVKVEGERRLVTGDVLCIGAQQLRIAIGEDTPQKIGSAPAGAPTPPMTEEAPETPATASPTMEASTAQPHVTFKGQDIAGVIDPSETLLEWGDERDVEMDSECWIGMCGCDAIRVLEGGEYLNEPDEKEIKTLTRLGLDPGSCRLACMTKASGPVVVEVMKAAVTE